MIEEIWPCTSYFFLSSKNTLNFYYNDVNLPVQVIRVFRSHQQLESYQAQKFIEPNGKPPNSLCSV